ncbi:Sec-independent protein translocase protein TatB [Tsuneonella mangrovi]|uniref:Sec-independent protein translocase protein TatB n=1 Tax=Tsuneonella mangrovi TaxID=1982042 RepID=UPI000BA29A9D|nr:Sec-independent protein translocase protein TatB [Tsuneonella mangrovi]
MFDIGWSEILLIVIVAVVVIGPKELPTALRTAGRWIGQVRRVSNHFRAGVEAMIREAEMEEMEKKWAEQNARIMAEHPEADLSEYEMTPLPAPEASDEGEPTDLLPAKKPGDEPELPLG